MTGKQITVGHTVHDKRMKVILLLRFPLKSFFMKFPLFFSPEKRFKSTSHAHNFSMRLS
jgi:hypothetical protein